MNEQYIKLPNGWHIAGWLRHHGRFVYILQSKAHPDASAKIFARDGDVSDNTRVYELAKDYARNNSPAENVQLRKDFSTGALPEQKCDRGHTLGESE